MSRVSNLIIFLLIVYSVDGLAVSRYPLTGSGDFIELVRRKFKIDKTLFIKDLIETDKIVTLITRPRRWGKTINLSMLKYFFHIETDRDGKPVTNPYRSTFQELKIGNASASIYDPEQRNDEVVGVVDKYQGEYPVIFITLKDVQSDTFEGMKFLLIKATGQLYSEYKYLATSPALDEYERKQFKDRFELYNKFSSGKIVRDEVDSTDISDSLLLLSRFLWLHFKSYKHKVMIFVDEYDTPLNSAFCNEYGEQAIKLMKSFLGTAYKDNPYLEKGVLTGILRFGKANLFSGLNNFVEDSVTDGKYAEYYGFTEEEVEELLHATDMSERIEVVRTWYDGYRIGGKKIYNPWSMVNYVATGDLLPYWIETGDTKLIESHLLDSSIQSDLKKLRNEEMIEKKIAKQVTLADIPNSVDAIWSFLLHTGYLTTESRRFDEKTGQLYYSLKIPNIEVKAEYQSLFERWLRSRKLSSERTFQDIDRGFDLIISGDQAGFSQLLEQDMPMDFTGPWNFNWLHIAALTNNPEMIKLVLQKSTLQLQRFNDSEGLGAADYAFLGNSSSRLFEGQQTRLAVPNMLQKSLHYLSAAEAAKIVLESNVINYIGGVVGSFLSFGIMWHLVDMYLFTQHRDRHKTFFTAGKPAVGIVTFAIGAFIKWLWDPRGVLYQSVSLEEDPSLMETLLQFEKYILDHPTAYVTLGSCKQGYQQISEIKKLPVEVPHLQIKERLFRLCFYVDTHDDEL